MSALRIVTAPAAEPLTLAQAKEHLRFTSTDEDALILGLIIAARVRAETITRRALVTQTWEYSLDEFPRCEGVIEMPRPILQSVTSITYIDEAGDSQTLSSSLYQADLKSEPGRIVPAYGQAWPATRDGYLNPVTIRFVAGYGLAAAVPQPIKQAMLLMIGHWFYNREDTVIGTIVSELPSGVEELLFPYRIIRL